MISFQVSGMTCGGCTKAITRAIQSADPNAIVQADLNTQVLQIETSLSAKEAMDIVDGAGFPVQA